MKEILKEKKALNVIALDVDKQGFRTIFKGLVRMEGRKIYLYQPGQRKVKLESLEGLHLDSPAARRRLRRKLY